MSESSLLGAARAAAGTDTAVSRADHDTALTAARAEGERAGKEAGMAEGRKAGEGAAYARLGAVLGHADVKGRELAAVNLAVASPTMSADAVAAFVKANVAEPAAGGGGGSRLDAIMRDPPLTPDGGKEKAGESGIDLMRAAAARTNARAKAGRL